MSDEITLTFPAERPFHGVARLVVGGLGVRLELTFDELEDVQVAIGALLECCSEDDEVTLRVEADGDGSIDLSFGPFDQELLERELEQETEDGLTLRRVLEAVSDRIDISAEDDGAWVLLTKRRVAAHG
jgi:hypothetical protein